MREHRAGEHLLVARELAQRGELLASGTM